ncbi:MAG TPA: sugar phosphate isomerase/epimerase family protein [Gaiellaceae bacterium]|nr:sugar phosphate isomerase/epimerase family protein [Gaiellaceae bacterium]
MPASPPEQRPRFSISQISTLGAPFAEDVETYRAAGVEGLGIWELKLPEGGDAAALERLAESGLASTNAVPLVPSVLPLPLMEGPADPQERIERLCASLHRLAPFRPDAVVCLTGPAGDLGAERARSVLVDGLRTLAGEARATGLRIGLEPYSRHGGEQWTIANTLAEAAELIDEAGVTDAVGLLFDVWHLWDDPALERDLRELAGSIVGVHVSDVREPTRSFADRLLPGDGVADVPRILGLLDRAGWDGFYDLEIFSDNGVFGHDLPDSLWNLAPGELARRGREAFLACWEART